MKLRRQLPPPDFLRFVQHPIAVKTITDRDYRLVELQRDLSVDNELKDLKEKWKSGTLEYKKYVLTPNRDLEKIKDTISELFCFEKKTDIPIVKISLIANVTYVFKNYRIFELHFSSMMGATDASDAAIRIDNCWIGRLLFGGAPSGASMTIIQTWLGLIDLTAYRFQRLEMTSGGLLLVVSPPPYETNPFIGSVIFDKVYLPRRDGTYQSRLAGYQPWASMRAHVLALGNQRDAGLFHASQLSIEEQYEEWGAAKIVSWLYRIGSDYGNSIGRPALLLGGSVVVLCALYLLTGAAVPAAGDSLQGWRSIFADLGCRGQFWRALYLSASPVLNPLGAVLGGSPSVEPSNVLWAIVQGAHRLISIMLIFLLFLGIRRRFRM